MTIPNEDEIDLVIRNSEEAIGALVDTVVGQKVPRWHYGEDWLLRALGLTKYLDHKIGEFVRDVVDFNAVDVNVLRRPHSDDTYLILRDHPSPRVEVVEGHPYFLQMNFDSKEVWIHLHHLHPIAEAKVYIWKRCAGCAHFLHKYR